MKSTIDKEEMDERVGERRVRGVLEEGSREKGRWTGVGIDGRERGGRENSDKLEKVVCGQRWNRLFWIIEQVCWIESDPA